jgi:hypothetical protein
MGSSQKLPSDCWMMVNCGMRHVPVSRAWPVNGVMGSARDEAGDVGGGGRTVKDICTVDLEVVVTMVVAPLVVPEADATIYKRSGMVSKD